MLILSVVTLGFERSVYTTSESNGSVVVCATVTIPSVGCPSALPFSNILMFLPGTAGNITYKITTVSFMSCYYDDGYVVTDSSDYVSEPDTLDFSLCSRRSCATMNIVNDAQLEEDESFSVTLLSSNQRVTLSSSTATIEINNDNDGRYICVVLSHYWTQSIMIGVCNQY